MLAIKCEERPKFLTSAEERTGKIRGVVAEFNLQVLLQASNGQCWRIQGNGKFKAAGPDETGQKLAFVQFDIRSTEEAV